MVGHGPLHRCSATGSHNRAVTDKSSAGHREWRHRYHAYSAAGRGSSLVSMLSDNRPNAASSSTNGSLGSFRAVRASRWTRKPRSRCSASLTSRSKMLIPRPRYSASRSEQDDRASSVGTLARSSLVAAETGRVPGGAVARPAFVANREPSRQGKTRRPYRPTAH